jgi:uncharacterized protein CbrC (UPF0167 family)
VTGSWEERGLAASYLEKESVHCECCGRVIVRRAWVVEGRVYCEPECERVYETYWLPRHGTDR